jgi:hypothetical protein
VCRECAQTRGSSHEGSDSGCVSIPLAAIFGYVVGNIGEHILEKIGSILRKIEFIWTLWNENEEENAWEFVWCGRGCLWVLLLSRKGRGGVKDELKLSAI